MASTPYAVNVGVASYPDIIPVTIPVFAASAIANADELTNYVPGFNFEVVKIDFVTVTPITTGGKTATINPYIDGTAVPNGTTTALAGTQAKGVVANVWTGPGTGTVAQGTHTYGSATSKLRLVASSVTAFTEGTGYFLVQLRNVGNLS